MQDNNLQQTLKRLKSPQKKPEVKKKSIQNNTIQNETNSLFKIDRLFSPKQDSIMSPKMRNTLFKQDEIENTLQLSKNYTQDLQYMTSNNNRKNGSLQNQLKSQIDQFNQNGYQYYNQPYQLFQLPNYNQSQMTLNLSEPKKIRYQQEKRINDTFIVQKQEIKKKIKPTKNNATQIIQSIKNDQQFIINQDQNYEKKQKKRINVQGQLQSLTKDVRNNEIDYIQTKSHLLSQEQSIDFQSNIMFENEHFLQPSYSKHKQNLEKNMKIFQQNLRQENLIKSLLLNQEQEKVNNKQNKSLNSKLTINQILQPQKISRIVSPNQQTGIYLAKNKVKQKQPLILNAEQEKINNQSLYNFQTFQEPKQNMEDRTLNMTQNYKILQSPKNMKKSAIKKQPINTNKKSNHSGFNIGDTLFNSVDQKDQNLVGFIDDNSKIEENTRIQKAMNQSIIKDVISQSFRNRNQDNNKNIKEESKVQEMFKKLYYGIDIVQFFLTYASYQQNIFVYCVRDSQQSDICNWYDLKIINLKDVEKYTDYSLISANGILHFYTQKGNQQFYENDLAPEKIPLQEWISEYASFKILKQVSTFKYYVINKIFNIWKQKSYYLDYNQRRKNLNQKCLWSKKIFCKDLFEIHKKLYMIQESQFMIQKLKQTRVNWELVEFLNLQKKNVENCSGETNEILQKVAILINNVIKNIDQQSGKIKQMNNKEQRKSIPIFQLKLQKQKQLDDLFQVSSDRKKINNLIRLVEYIKNNKLVNSLENSIEFLKNNLNRQDQKQGGVINVQIRFCLDKLDILPTIEKFKKVIQQVFQDIQRIPYRIDKILEFQQFKPYLNQSYQIDLYKIIEQNEKIQINKNQISSFIDKVFVLVQEDIDKKLNFVIEIEDDIILWQNKVNKNFLSKTDITLDYAKIQLQNTENLKAKIEKYLTDFSFGFMNILTQKNKKQALDHLIQKQEFFKNKIYNKMIEIQNNIDNEMQYYLKKLDSKITDLDSFNDLIQNQNKYKKCQDQFSSDFNQIQQISYVIRQFDLSKIKDSDYVLTEKIQKNIQILQNLDNQASTQINKNMNQNIEILQNNKKNILSQVKDYDHQIQTGVFIIDDLPEINMTTVLKDIEVVKKQFETFDKNIQTIQKRNEQLNNFEKLMQQPQDQSMEIQFLQNKFNDRRLIWNNIEQFQKNQKEWREREFSTLNLEEIEQKMRFYESSNNQLKQRINNLSEKGYDKQLEFFINEIKEFQLLLPIILSLGNKDMKEKHWQQMNTQINSKISTSKNFTINELVNLNIFEQKDLLMDISQKASGEQLITNQIANIKKKWDTMQFVVASIDDNPNKLKLTGIDDIIQTLDDHLVSIQGILSTRFVQEIRADIEVWQVKLVLIQETIDEWLTLQRNWIYLENIFNAQDIQRQLPDETQSFFQVNKFWRDLMVRSKKFPNVQHSCNNSELLIKLKYNNKQLDNILKCLDQYLNSKRIGFPRFYFLSNDELLEVLSQTKNPQSIQPHLRKLFDSINKITFDDLDVTDDEIILSMTSQEPELMPETVVFDKVVKIILGEKVEQFLTKIQEQMKNTLRLQTMKSYDNYNSEPELYLQWSMSAQPAQTLTTVTLIKWQEQMTEVFYNILQNPNIIHQQLKEQNERIKVLVYKVVQNLNIHHQQLICTFLIIEVHLRDIVEDLIQNKVNSLDNFDWVKQLRYYKKADQQDVNLLQTSAQLNLSYEYLGNSSRLVITNLTDKCYLTMTVALQFYLGGNPSGPAGTGKTETIKDLSKSLQIKCVVFNCSDTIDYKTMGRFFNGLSQCGCWACFDEFNRIDLEVLSVIAQQIQYIQKALAMKVKEFQFDENRITLIKTIGIFITTNPTYAGRQELPDNLKSLFRPIAMMVPDYQKICEIILMSDGFLEARMLGQKICLLFKLCSEQLSAQVHYDFGLRAIKSVILYAGQNKRQAEKDISDEQILVQSILDSSLPKFLEQDTMIFKDLIKDLFPQIQTLSNKNEEFENELLLNFQKYQYQVKDSFVEKIYQFLDTGNIRIGIMLIGLTGTGKSTIINLVQETYNKLKFVNPEKYNEICITKINPKAVSTNGLYGYINLLTNDWHDGIVAKICRSAIQEQTDQKQWILFDGPVDTLWAENLNTVLDDNRMLCLSNGQRMKLTSNIQFIFEVDDLKQASPATVSRCGMVFIDQNQLGWQPVLDTWLTNYLCKNLGLSIQQLSHSVSPFYKGMMILGKKLTNLLTDFIANERSSQLEFLESCLLQQLDSTIKLIESLLSKLIEQYNSIAQLDKISVLELEHFLSMIMIFSFIWGVGGNYYNDQAYNGREQFSQVMYSKFQSLYPSIPDDVDIFDLYIDFQLIKFRKFDTIVAKFHFDRNVSYFNLSVPTSDFVKFNHISNITISYDNNTLITGNSGVGKSVVIKELLQKLDPEKFIYKQLNFSAQTNTQNLIDIFSDKDKFIKKRRDLIGAPMGKKIILFVDDINMPLLDQFGAQPPIEFLRQLIVSRGFYDLKKVGFINLEDCIVLAACGPAGGGRSRVSPRLFRHFCILWMPNISQKTLFQIYNQILFGFLKNNPQDNISDKAQTIVQSSITIYKQICDRLLPIPIKCHYTFNPRDVAKVFQGMLQIKYMFLTDFQMLIDLWCHEFQRIFVDRMINNKDKELVYQFILNQVKGFKFANEMESINLKKLIFSDITSIEKFYLKIEDSKEIETELQNQLAEYNLVNRRMNLIFFQEAMQQIIRICRIIKIEQGNAILIGLGGSGRNSLTLLATFIRGYRNFSIEISNTYGETNWKDDLRKLLKQTGAKNIQSVLILSDNNIQKESYLEDINNILNTGEVPNLMAFEDLEEIYSEMRIIVKERGLFESRENMSKLFIQLIRENLHLVICLSPVGNKLRNRCRSFPAIFNGCTIIWFDKWPNEALESIAFRELCAQESLNIGHHKTIVSKEMMKMNQTVFDAATRITQSQKRRIYITPSIFLEHLKVFISLMKNQQNILPLNLKNYNSGLKSLRDTNKEVEKLQIQIKQLQPFLDQSLKENGELLVVLDKSSKEAKETEIFVQKETNEAQTKKDTVNDLKEECRIEYEEALPTLKAAQAAVMNIDKTQLNIIKSYVNPPKLVVTVLDATCLLFGYEENWDTSKRYLLGDMRFLEKLIDFDLKKTPESRFLKLREKYFTLNDFKKENIIKQSEAAGSIYEWLIAIDMYQKVKKNVDPKEKKLIEAQAYLEKVDAMLAEKKDILQKIQEKVNDLNKQLDASNQKSAKLTQELETSKIQLKRAEKLVTGLQSEALRWEISKQTISQKIENLLGNMLISSAFIVYLGPFDQEDREIFIESWITKLKGFNIPLSQNYSLQKILCDDNIMREWQDFGLPSNELSQQNGIIINNCIRWPLIIDPQSQANLWFKKWLKSNGLIIIKLDDPNFMINLESCIRNGLPILIENVEEWIDPVMDPIFAKDIYKKAFTYYIKMGENELQYNNDFKLYMTTRMSNPHYVPEITIKVTVINFTVTSEGLEEQLLAEVIKYERLDLEQQRVQLIKQISMDLSQIKNFEQTILLQITEASQILEDDRLVTTLDNTKEMSMIINERMQNAGVTQDSINQAREHYRDIAKRGSSLYFVIAELSQINHMYKWSLDYFINFFKVRLKESKQSNERDQRISILIDDITINTYKTICRGLFNKDKLLFSFILTVKIQISQQQINQETYNLFLYGHDATRLLTQTDDQKPSFLDSYQFKSFNLQSQDDPRYFAIIESFKLQEQQWQEYMDSSTPWLMEFKPIEYFNFFDKLVFYKLTHPRFMIDCVIYYIQNVMGDQILQQVALDLKDCHKDSYFNTPLIFVLSKGADPMQYLNEFANQTIGSLKFKTLSLGQGQGPKAKELIMQARRNGEWVCLQNCHLALSWMTALEKIQENQDENDIHPFYRLWLTSLPNDQFSENVLQQGIKIIVEPPTGIKANLITIYNQFNDNTYNTQQQQENYKKILYNIALFHSILSERKKYGPLGFNIQYDWMLSDFFVSQVQLQTYCEQNESIPYKALNVLIGELNYGGRVTDFLDQRLINAILLELMNDETIKTQNLPNYYKFPSNLNLPLVKEYLESLPDQDDPTLFGLNPNAAISHKYQFTQQFLISIRLMNNSSQSENLTLDQQNQQILKLITQIELLTQSQLNSRQISKQSPITLYRNQETSRYNILIKQMKNTVFDLQRAIKGLNVMSQALEAMFYEMLENKVPKLWTVHSYLSVKSLGSWLADFGKRIEFLKNWVLRQKMSQYLLSAFYFPQGFFTAVKCNYSREYKLPIEKIDFVCEIKELSYKPDYLKDGVIIYGMFLEGCKTNDKNKLDELHGTQIQADCPLIQLNPEISQNTQQNVYNCPVYKTHLRAGELNSTGHSTNYIISLNLECENDEKYWTRRGAAIVCQIQD